MGVYKRFRNPASSGAAIAGAIRFAYAPLYVRNEFMHELNDTELLGVVVEETGQHMRGRSSSFTTAFASGAPFASKFAKAFRCSTQLTICRTELEWNYSPFRQIDRLYDIRRVITVDHGQLGA